MVSILQARSGGSLRQLGGGLSVAECLRHCVDYRLRAVHLRMMGILTVDLVDAKKRQLVWRGQATEDSISDTQKGDERQVQKSVEKMFDRFPPKNHR